LGERRHGLSINRDWCSDSSFQELLGSSSVVASGTLDRARDDALLRGHDLRPELAEM